MNQASELDANPITDLIFEITQTFFRLRAAGQREGLVNPWGGGTLGFLRSLAVGGPQTVPQLARARPVARQRIQKIADELADEGLIEFFDNPAHKRSKLLRLTTKGEIAYADLMARFESLSALLGAGLNSGDVAVARSVLADLRKSAADYSRQ